MTQPRETNEEMLERLKRAITNQRKAQQVAKSLRRESVFSPETEDQPER